MNENPQTEKRPKKPRRALTVLGWILMVFSVYVFVFGSLFLMYNKDTGTEGSDITVKASIIVSAALVGVAYIMISTGRRRRRKKVNEGDVRPKTKKLRVSYIIVPVLLVTVGSLISLGVIVLPGFGSSKEKYVPPEFVLSKEQITHLEKLMASNGMPLSGISTERKGDAPDEKSPWIAVRNDSVEPRLCAWSEADSFRDSDPSADDVRRIKTIVYCDIYEESAMYSGGGRMAGIYSQGARIYYINAQTGKVYDTDEIKPSFPSAIRESQGKVKLYDEDLAEHIDDHIKGKNNVVSQEP